MAEARRLDEIFAGVRTLEDAIAKLGPPDEDFPNGVTMHTPETDGKPPEVRSFRVIRYRRLSETADVHLTDYQKDRVDIHYQGKDLSKPDSR